MGRATTTPVALLASLLPWLLLLVPSGTETLLAFLLVGTAVTGAGFGLLTAAGLLRRRPLLRAAFAPGTGFLLFTAACALCARFDLPASPLFWLFTAVGAAACAIFLKAMAGLRRPAGTQLWALAVLSLAVALVYFRPAAAHNGALQEDGSYSWLDVDASFDMSLAAGIKHVRPPVMPGLAQGRLVYHYGAYALAAFCSKFLGVEVGRAMVVVHGIGLIALICGAAGLSRAALPGPAAPLAPAFGAAGVFFLGSSIEPVLRAFGPTITDVHWSGSMFPHYYYGHSLLWGLAALTTLFGLVLAEEPVKQWWLFPLLAASAAASNFFGGLIGGGTAAVLVLVDRWRRPSAWPVSLVTLLAPLSMIYALGAVSAIGSDRFSKYALNLDLASIAGQAPEVLGPLLGLGAALYAFRFLAPGPSKLIGPMILLLTAGSTVFALLVADGTGQNNLYPLHFLHHLLALFALVALAAQAEKGGPEQAAVEGGRLFGYQFRAAAGVLAILLVLSVGLLLQGRPAPSSYAFLAVTAAGIAAAAAGMRLLCGWSSFRPLVPAALVCVTVLAVGEGVPSFFDYGFPGSSMAVSLSAGEVAGLRKLKAVSRPGDLVLTNRHFIPERPEHPASYQYGAVSERPMLLEGWVYGEEKHRLFKKTREDAAAVFRFDDPDTVRGILDTYGIRYILCVPGDCLENEEELPVWLTGISGAGTTPLYRYDHR